MELIAHYVRKYGFLIRYGITGVIGAVLQTFILFVWVSVLGLTSYYLWGLVVGFCITLGVSFTLQKYWTFSYREHHHRSHYQFVMYGVTAAGSLVLNTILLHASKQLIEAAGHNFFNGWYLVAQVVIIFIIAVASFLVNYFITFKEKKES